MKKLAILFFAVVFSVCFYSTAFAGVVDWTQLFQQSQTEIYEGNNVGPFDKIMIWWKSGDKFSSAGAFSNFSESGWGINNVNDVYACALGPGGSTYTQFDINFAGPKSAGTEFWAAVSSNNIVRQRQILTFDGSNWTYPGISESSWKDQGGPSVGPSVTPEPISSALFIVGAGALGIIKTRRNKKVKV